LDPTVIAAPLGNPPEDPFASSGRPLRNTLPEEPFATSFEDTLPGTFRGQPLGNPSEDPFASSGRPLRTLFRRLLRNPFRRPSRRSPRKPLRQPPRSTPPPFRIPSEHAACPESFRSRREALPSAPFEAFAGTFFG